MSQFALSFKTLALIYQKATTYQYHRTVNREYCIPLMCSEQETERWLMSLARLNGWSDSDLQECREQLSWNYRVKVDAIQMLKWLNCLHYNLIDENERPRDTQEEKDVNRLESAIYEIQSRIIADTEDYETAGWCDEPTYERPRKVSCITRAQYLELQTLTADIRQFKEKEEEMETAMEECKKRTPICRLCKKYSDCNLFQQYESAITHKRIAKQKLADKVIEMFNL